MPPHPKLVETSELPVVDYTSLAFFPSRWRERSEDAQMLVYETSNIVFLCLRSRGPYDPAVMSYFLSRLDSGWQTCLEVIHSPSPAPRSMAHVINGKAAIIAAVPDAGLTCGYGCGYCGLGGIEVSGFYKHDYPDLLRESRGGSPLRSFPHYYFYEFGRNFCIFGPKHAAFGTGFAVLLRYFLMDADSILDPDPRVRIAIEKCEELYAETADGFGRDFVSTMARCSKQDEKCNRIPGHSPSDQPCMYASAQLRLARKYGGGEWMRKFFSTLKLVPELRENACTPRVQCEIWFFCASIAAGRLLEDEFVRRWRFDMEEEKLQVLRKLKWGQDADKCIGECIASQLIPGC